MARPLRSFSASDLALLHYSLDTGRVDSTDPTLVDGARFQDRLSRALLEEEHMRELSVGAHLLNLIRQCRRLLGD